MDNLYQWDRNDKLFAIRSLKHTSRSEKDRYLLQVIVDEDPVVRGKAALAMKNCADSTLLEAVETLLEQDQSETTILACELLGFTEDVDFTDKVSPLLRASDDRVVRSAIEVLNQLPEERAIELLHQVAERYDDEWSKSVKRVLSRIDSPDLLSVLQKLYDRVDNNFRLELLRIGANLNSEAAVDWVEAKLSETDHSEAKESVIRWLLNSS